MRAASKGFSAPTQASDPLVITLLVSGTLGFTLGAGLYPTWHHAIESAQAIAGVVSYPSNNPFHLYHMHAWSGLHQICAGLLFIGFSERVIAYFLSGLVGLLSFQALSATILALSRNPSVSIVFPLVILELNAVDFGVSYPVWLMDHFSSYGMFGLSWSALTLGLLGCGKLRAASLFMGMAPTIHPVLGLYTSLLIMLTWAIRARRLGAIRDFANKYLAAGLLVTGFSLLAQLSICDIEFIPRNLDTAIFLRSFAKYWSSHHITYPFLSMHFLLLLSCLILGPVTLHILSEDLDSSQKFLILCITIAAGTGVVFSVDSHLPSAYRPDLFLTVQPLRLANICILLLPGITAGLAFKYRYEALLLSVAGLLAIIMLTAVSLVAGKARQDSVHWLVGVLMILTWAGCVALRLRPIGPRHSLFPGLLMPILTGLIAAIFVVTIPVRMGKSWLHGDLSHRKTYQLTELTRMKDWRDDLFLARVSQRDGLLLASSIHLAQLLTRRPVLLPAAINQVIYVPDSGPEMARIMREVYGVDLLSDPGEEYRRAGILHPQMFQLAWVDRSTAEWQRLAERFGFSDVLVYKDISLKLPLVAESENFAYYVVPRQATPGSGISTAALSLSSP